MTLDPAVMAAAPAGPIGVAVSGGSDSIALLLKMRDWAAGRREVAAVTVDHGLRAEAAAEAAGVARLCADLGIAHDALDWRDWDGRGNLQDAAREARRRLIGGWARARGIGAVALGHTLDDQAETFLMRLARGSGVDGLAAMAGVSRAEGLIWLRPLLSVRRADLRDGLSARGVAWAEDPSNGDDAYLRVRARAALAPLERLGMGAARLAETAARMGRARTALEAMTETLALDCLEAGPAGDLFLDPEPWRAAPEEIRLRLAAGALTWVAGARFRPRLSALEAACEALSRGAIGRGLTLHGCVLRPAAGRIAIRREPAQAAPNAPAGAGVWDNRWRLEKTERRLDGLEIGALGAAGLAARPRWRETGLAREALLTTPALWRAGRLLEASALDPDCAATFRRISAAPPPWRDAELRLKPPPQSLC